MLIVAGVILAGLQFLANLRGSNDTTLYWLGAWVALGATNISSLTYWGIFIAVLINAFMENLSRFESADFAKKTSGRLMIWGEEIKSKPHISTLEALRTYLVRKPKSTAPVPEYVAPPPPPPPPPPRKIPPELEIFGDIFKQVTTADLQELQRLVRKLVPHELIKRGPGLKFGRYFTDAYEAGRFSEAEEQVCMNNEAVIKEMSRVTVGITLPEKKRVEHHHIVAGTGAGKSQCIENLVLDDVANGASVIVIDSQNELINRLATRLPNPILVDPVHCPPPLNLFAIDASADLFEYIFQALDAEMTSKQSTAYRYVSRLVVQAEGNIHLMRKLLEPGKLWQEYADLMSETARSFFETEYSSKQFDDTRQQILRRLYQVLENESFERMIGSDRNAIEVGEIIKSGRPLLISTAKSDLRQQGASLLGRIFIAQVMHAVFKGTGKRAYLYMDEFQDYAEDSHVLFNLFEQARKNDLGLVIAHQYLGQLPMQLQQSIAANTAIKFARNVSADDASKLSKQMNTTPEMIQTMPAGVFACHIRDHGFCGYGIEFGKLDKAPELASLSAIREQMRREFSPLPHQPDPRKTVKVRRKREQGSGEVPESGDW